MVGRGGSEEVIRSGSHRPVNLEGPVERLILARGPFRLSGPDQLRPLSPRVPAWQGKVAWAMRRRRAQRPTPLARSAASPPVRRRARRLRCLTLDACSGEGSGPVRTLCITLCTDGGQRVHKWVWMVHKNFFKFHACNLPDSLAEEFTPAL
jgi:hypothetical protein